MIKRLNDLRLDNNKLYRKIAERQRAGTMSYVVDNDGYVCYDTEELKSWKPRRAGRKAKTFKCEICGQTTPRQFEGGEPNCCEDCIPLTETQLMERKKALQWEKLTRTHKYYRVVNKCHTGQNKEK